MLRHMKNDLPGNCFELKILTQKEDNTCFVLYNKLVKCSAEGRASELFPFQDGFKGASN